ncbi:unnamed protein product, partial [Allacma fusca]
IRTGPEKVSRFLLMPATESTGYTGQVHLGVAKIEGSAMSREVKAPGSVFIKFGTNSSRNNSCCSTYWRIGGYVGC